MPKRETPLLAVDAIITYNNNLVLIRRKNPPFKGDLALPGGFVDIGETVENACIREVYEETNIKVRVIKLVGVFSDPKRDPRGHVVSVAFLCEPLSMNEVAIAKDDATSIELIKLDELHSKKLAFDHLEIIKSSGILANQS
ncbi:MAG: NUDIX domain-containing protein [Candidatus Hodarchaeota archaeon]